MTLHELTEALKDYRDEFGLISPKRLVQPHRGDASGNGLCYTAIFGILCTLLHSDARQRRTRIKETTEAIKRCQVKPGLWILNRSPAPHPDQNAWDDYLHVLCFLQAAGEWQEAAALSLELMQKRTIWGPFGLSYYMNNEKYVREGATEFKHPDGRWNKSAWIGRFPALRAQAQMIFGKLSLLHKLAWAVSMWLTSKKPETAQGAYRTSWMMAQAYDALCEISILPRSKIMDWGYRKFRKRIESLPSFAITQRNYFEDNHPYLKAWELSHFL